MVSADKPRRDHAVLPYTEAAIRSIQSGSGRCFLCGREASTGAGEHVFPKWLQTKYNLWDERLRLLNGSLIAYRQLKVPCCEICNTSVLSEIERQIAQACDAELSPEAIDRLALGRWLAKILVALLVQETRLAVDRSNRVIGTIFPKQMMDDFFHTHLILQSARKPTSFVCLHGDYPFTLYTYGIQRDDRFSDYDFSTCLPGLSVAMRFGSIGAVLVADGGLQAEIGAKGPYELLNHNLHPIQFSEMASRIHYKAYLRDATHFYVTAETPDWISMNQVHVRSFSGLNPETGEQRIFQDWDEEELGQMMSAYMGRELNDVYDKNSRTTYTCLVRPDGSAPRPSSGPV